VSPADKLRLHYAGDGKGKKGARDVAGREEKSDIYKLVKMVMERGYDPVSLQICQDARGITFMMYSTEWFC
jgi:hypothetical protein